MRRGRVLRVTSTTPRPRLSGQYSRQALSTYGVATWLSWFRRHARGLGDTTRRSESGGGKLGDRFCYCVEFGPCWSLTVGYT